MSLQKYVVTGATGHVGGVIANRLLEAKRSVRVIGRTAERLQPFTQKGAEAAAGSLEDAAFLKRTLKDATALFAMVPPNFALQTGFRAYQNRIVDGLIEAIRGSSVTHVLTLSSIGAHLTEGAGPVNGLGDMEKKLKALPNVNVLNLRPAYFLENSLGSIGMIKQMGANGGAMKADQPIPMIATRDIGQVAAKRLLELDFKGQSVLELMGAKDVSMNELTRALGAAIGKPDLKYLQFPYEDAQKSMVGMGLPAEIAGLYMEMTRGFNEGTIKSTQPRSAETTTPTTIEMFAKEVFAPAFNAS